MRILALAILCLSACDHGPEVPTATENRDLEDAARMLDNADDDLAGIDENRLAPPPTDPQI